MPSLGLGLGINSVRYPGAVDPIAGLSPAVWLKANEIPGLVDEDVVDSWPDSSGNGNDATQGTFVKMPVYHPGEVAFDGSDDFLATSSLLFTDLTICVAFTLAAAGDYPMLVVPNTGGFRELRFDGNTRVPQWIVGGGGCNGIAPVTLSTKTLISVRHNSVTGDCDMWVNGAQVSTGTSAYVPTAGVVYLGSRDGAGFFLNGAEHEVVIFPSALSDENLEAVQTSIADRNSIILA